MGQHEAIGREEEADDDPDEEMLDDDAVTTQHQWGRGFMIGNRLGEGREEPMDDAAGRKMDNVLLRGLVGL